MTEQETALVIAKHFAVGLDDRQIMQKLQLSRRDIRVAGYAFLTALLSPDYIYTSARDLELEVLGREVLSEISGLHREAYEKYARSQAMLLKAKKLLKKAK